MYTIERYAWYKLRIEYKHKLKLISDNFFLDQISCSIFCKYIESVYTILTYSWPCSHMDFTSFISTEYKVEKLSILHIKVSISLRLVRKGIYFCLIISTGSITSRSISMQNVKPPENFCWPSFSDRHIPNVQTSA